MQQWAPRRRSTTGVAAILALLLGAGVAFLTLAPRRVEQRAPEFVAGALSWVADTLGPMWATIGVADFVANILMFVPAGILAFLLIPRRLWPLALAVSPVISSLVELSQALFLPERVASATDVLAATIGGAAGVTVAGVCTLLTARRITPVAPLPEHVLAGES